MAVQRTECQSGVTYSCGHNHVFVSDDGLLLEVQWMQRCSPNPVAVKVKGVQVRAMLACMAQAAGPELRRLESMPPAHRP